MNKLPDGKVRITVDLETAPYLALQALAKKLGSPTTSKVVRDALRIYEFLVDEKLKGSEFQVVEKDTGKITAVVFLT